ncbi:MAG: DUF3429 domain-containing protein [Azonexus sp.]
MTTLLPRSVAWLGYGGLIPFVSLTAAFLLDHHHGLLWSDALIGYGAVILSFVGALHWAFAMTLPGLTDQQRTARFVWSVVPALLAWLALLVDATMATVLLVPGFIAHYLQDRKLVSSQRLPDWYLPLRFRLTGVACLCLIVVGVLSFG